MLVLVLIKQIIIMAVLVAVGLFLSKKHFLSAQGTKDLGAILLKLIIPCVIIKSYLVDFSMERLKGLALSALLCLIGYVIAMVLSGLVFGTRRPIENFASSFCNAGFIGIPLVQAVVGDEGVFYLAISIAMLNLFQWTYGVYVMTKNKEAISAKTIIKNPVVIALIIGLALFFIPVQIPTIIETILGYIAGMNTPIAMILIGTYMAGLSFKRIVATRRAYSCVLMRLIVIPAVTLLVFALLPIHNYDVLITCMLAFMTSVGANICIFAQQYDSDYELSVITVCLSTILSIVTVPVFFVIAQRVL